jgi:hypothetical protein
MAETVYISDNETAVFRCPSCQRTKTMDMSAYRESGRVLKFKLKCPCGHVATTIVEKRRRYRKETSFPGTYIHYVDGQPKGKGACTVKDVSNNGMKLLISAKETFTVGDMLKVSFHLDDAPRSRIQKKVVVRNVSLPYIGTEFAPTETIDKALGFYLRS